MSEQGPTAPSNSVAERPRLRVTVVTGDRTTYADEADVVLAPGTRGQLGIHAMHAPLLAALEPGELVVRLANKEQVFALGGGFLEVRNNEVIVLADSVERPEEIDVERAEAARQRARSLVERYGDRAEAVAARQALERSRARLKVAKRARRQQR